MTKYKMLGALGFACISMFGCNTMRGMGQDVQEGGQMLQGAADDLRYDQRFTIAANASPGGAITPSENVFLTHGGSRTFTFEPDTGYRTVDVIVDGRSIGPRRSYTFSNVRMDHTISVAFGLR